MAARALTLSDWKSRHDSVLAKFVSTEFSAGLGRDFPTSGFAARAASSPYLASPQQRDAACRKFVDQEAAIDVGELAVTDEPYSTWLNEGNAAFQQHCGDGVRAIAPALSANGARITAAGNAVRDLVRALTAPCSCTCTRGATVPPAPP